MTSEQRETHWERAHRDQSYETVWSITEDRSVRDKIIDTLNELDNPYPILIPGCGSRTFLQEDMISRLNGVGDINCTDFQEVVKIASSEYSHDRVLFTAANSTNLPFSNECGSVVIVNSILSDSDLENRKMIEQCFKALRPSGYLVGFFPNILATIDLGYLENDPDQIERADVQRCLCYEPEQDIYQIFYTPLRLKFILEKAGFKICRFENFFFDSEYFKEHSQEIYGIRDEDISIYESFIVAQKVG